MAQTRADYEAALREAVNRIATRFDPDQIILFGSAVRGQDNPDSDADLLVVMPVCGSKRQQAVQIDMALAGIPIPIDVIVVTPDDVMRYRDVPGTVVGTALHEGKVLHERAA